MQKNIEGLREKCVATEKEAVDNEKVRNLSYFLFEFLYLAQATLTFDKRFFFLSYKKISIAMFTLTIVKAFRYFRLNEVFICCGNRVLI